MYWCYRCYAVNRRASGVCVRCGQPIQAPPGLSFEDQLVWALGHPDGSRPLLAAKTLGVRRASAALPALRRVVDDGADPFLAVEALRSAIAIAGCDDLRGWLQQLPESDSFMVSAVARQALA